MLSFYSKKTADICLHFTHISQQTTQVTTPFCKKRFDKGFSAEIYYLFASEQLLMYLHPVFLQQKQAKLPKRLQHSVCVLVTHTKQL